MTNKLYVGNLPYTTTEDQLHEVFGAYGTVQSATIITDRDTGRSKGFAFVEMSTPEEATEAMEKLNGTQLGDRTIKVDLARPRRDDGGGRGRDRGQRRW